MAVLLTPPYLQFFDDDGAPLAGGKVNTYTATGTFATRKATFTTVAGDVEHPNPVILDASGRPTTGNGSIWLEGTYDFVVTDADDATIETTLGVIAFTTTGTASDAYFQSFSGTGAQTAFTTSEDLGTDEKAIFVWVDAGAGKGYEIQNPSAYTISNTTLTFSVAPASGTNNIYVSAPSLLVGSASSAAADASASAAAALASQSAAETAETNAETAETNAETAATAAAASVAALSATSTTSLAIGVGAKTFTTQSGKLFVAGQYLQIASDASALNYMHGTVTSYSGTTLIMNITDIGGSGTLADWNISISGTQGTTGATGPAGGAISLLQSQTASASASITFNSTYITTTYKEYIIELINVAPATDNQALQVNVTQSNSPVTTASSYDTVMISGTGSTTTTGSTTDQTVMIISGTAGNATNENICGTVKYFNPTAATLTKKVKADLGYELPSGALETCVTTGRFKLNTNACDGIRFTFTGGNIASGIFNLYGVA